MDFFKNLALDAWYKALVYVGGAGLLLAFFVDARGVSNTDLQILLGGVFLLGLGEWKNNKIKSWIKPPNVYTGPTLWIDEPIRKPDVLGLLLDGFGIALIILGLYRILVSG